MLFRSGESISLVVSLGPGTGLDTQQPVSESEISETDLDKYI